MNRIGLYAGSFNPFHRGHYDILQKAEAIFDEVIVARGVNPEKSPPTYEIPDLVAKNRLIIEYHGLLTDVIKKYKKEYDNITLIRGLRNSTDLQYEMTQYRFLQDLMPDIQVVSIFCDKEYEHISSSAIKMLYNFDKESAKKYLLY